MPGSLLVVQFVAVGMSVYCMGAFEIQLLKCRGIVGCNRPYCVQGGTYKHTDTHTHKNTVRRCYKGKRLNCGCCRTMAVAMYRAGGRGNAQHEQQTAQLI